MRLNDVTALPPIAPWSSKLEDRSRKPKRDDEPVHADGEVHAVDLVEERRAGLAEHHELDIRV